MRDHHADTADYVRGELEARSRNDPVFFGRYFGHAQTWANPLRHQRHVVRRMARGVVAAAMAQPKRTAELTALLRPLALEMVTGIAPRVALNRLAVAFDEFAVERLPLPAAWRWMRFLRAHARVVHLTQLEWIRHRKSRPALLPGLDRLPIERLVPDTVIGVHALEEHGGRPFRWTEPVALFRLAPSEDEHELRIETGGIRGDPLSSVIGVVADGHVLPRERLASDDEGTLLCGCRRLGRPPPETGWLWSVLRWPRRARDRPTDDSWACQFCRSRSTSCSAGHDGSTSSGASKSFSIHAEYKFSVVRFHASLTGQTRFPVACGRGGSLRCTAISRVIVLHSADAPSRVSFACHVPAAGAATSANQKYGGPPCRSRDLAATFPSGAIRESSPSSGFSAAKTTRKGAPFHGAIGEKRTASSAASSQVPDGPLASASTTEKRETKNTPAISNNAIAAAAANWRAGNNRAPGVPRPQLNNIVKAFGWKNPATRWLSG
jgi:hypothetical protein